MHAPVSYPLHVLMTIGALVIGLHRRAGIRRDGFRFAPQQVVPYVGQAGLGETVLAARQSNNGQMSSPHALSSHSGTNFCRQFFSTHRRSWPDLSYCSGDNFSRAATRSKSEGTDGVGAAPIPCDHRGLPRLGMVH